MLYLEVCLAVMMVPLCFGYPAALPGMPGQGLLRAIPLLC